MLKLKVAAVLALGTLCLSLPAAQAMAATVTVTKVKSYNGGTVIISFSTEVCEGAAGQSRNQYIGLYSYDNTKWARLGPSDKGTDRSLEVALSAFLSGKPVNLQTTMYVDTDNERKCSLDSIQVVSN